VGSFCGFADFSFGSSSGFDAIIELSICEKFVDANRRHCRIDGAMAAHEATLTVKRQLLRLLTVLEKIDRYPVGISEF
jgi:hypothetical protein